jgi:DNA-binding response OmpR family regulator
MSPSPGNFCRRPVVSHEVPKIVVVEQEGGDLNSPSRLLQGQYRVATCLVESVALEYVTESRPAAVLLDATALYLEGPGIVERWRTASPGTRVLFLDTEGPWALLMELSSAESGSVAINPCALGEVASAVHEMLGRDPDDGRKEVRDDRMAVVAV